MSYFLGFLLFPVLSPVDVNGYLCSFSNLEGDHCIGERYEKQLRMVMKLRHDRVLTCTGVLAPDTKAHAPISHFIIMYLYF